MSAPPGRRGDVAGDQAAAYDPLVPQPPDPRLARKAWDELVAAGGLTTLSGIAKRRDVSRQAINALSGQPSFPAPAIKRPAPAGSLYLTAAIESWQADWNARTDKPGPSAGHASTRDDAAVTAAAQAWGRVQRHGGLVTLTDLAERWEVTQQRVSTIAKAADFPPPAHEQPRKNLYLLAEVLAWRAKTHAGPRPGPPPRAAAG